MNSQLLITEGLIPRCIAAGSFISEEPTMSDIEIADFVHLPICIAKTQYRFSTDPKLKGTPTGHAVPIREVRLSAGAGFIVVVCGDIMTMPGLPRIPSANHIRINDEGQIEGLF